MSRAVLVLFFALSSCAPWTVVPIGEEPAVPHGSDPKAYVDSIWDARLMPAVLEGSVAVDAARSRQAAGQGGHFLVKGAGRALDLNGESRSGKLLVDLEPADGEADVAILIGPAILTTALRDAAGFIRFTDFANQLAFADVANELNQRVIDSVIAPLDLESLVGRRIAFHGACSLTGPGLPEIVPVRLEAE